MNWIHLTNSSLTSREQQDLYVMLIITAIACLGFLRPTKPEYINVFIAWIVFLVLVVSTIGVLWFLFSFRLIPYTFGLGYLDQVYWMILGLTAFAVIQRSMDAITKRLKIKKLTTNEN